MTPHRPLVPTFLLGLPLLLALPSCEVLQELTKNLSKPTASIAGVRLDDLDLESLSLLFDVDVENPYAVELPVVGLSYDIRSGGQGVLQGALQNAGAIPAGASKRLEVPARIQFKDLLSVLSGVRPGQVIPYTADLGLDLDLPGDQDLNIPLGTSGELPIPAVPEVELLGVRWTTLTLNRAEAQLDLSILNPNEFGLDLNQLEYALSLGGKKVAKAGVAPGAALGAGGSDQLSVPISFAPIDLGVAVFNLLKGSEAGYSLDGLLDVGTPYGDLDMPYARAGKTALFH